MDLPHGRENDMTWTPINIAANLYQNVDEIELRTALAGIENAYINEAGSHKRFPGLKVFANLPGSEPVYLYRHSVTNDVYAVSNSRVYRIDRDGNYADLTEAPLSGNGRPVFTETVDEVVIAAGGPIIRCDGKKTEVLSPDAPDATHVAYIDSILLANEKDSGRFAHANFGDARTWDPLDVFAADSKPDHVTAVIVTPYREILVAGPQSVEQYSRLEGDTPFYRRWTVDEGVIAPYTMVFEDGGVFCVNSKKEFVRLSLQNSEPVSGDIARVLAAIPESQWRDAWSERFEIDGQRFLMLQIPEADTPYGGKGLTYLFDVKQRKWSMLYGWNPAQAIPEIYPVHSVCEAYDRVVCGGNGVLYEMTPRDFVNASKPQRMIGRTAHLGNGTVEISDTRLRIVRGIGGYTGDPVIRMRCRVDNRYWSAWVERGLGRTGTPTAALQFGGFGTGEHFQFEWEIIGNCPVTVMGLDADIMPVEW